MKAKFFFVGPPGSDFEVSEVEEQLNNFLDSVKVVNVLQSSAAYGSIYGNKIETLITVLYELPSKLYP